MAVYDDFARWVMCVSASFNPIKLLKLNTYAPKVKKKQVRNAKCSYSLQEHGCEKVDLISAKETQDWRNVIEVTYRVKPHTHTHTPISEKTE